MIAGLVPRHQSGSTAAKLADEWECCDIESILGRVRRNRLCTAKWWGLRPILEEQKVIAVGQRLSRSDRPTLFAEGDS